MSISSVMRNNIQALDRGLSILELMATGPGEARVTDIARELGVHKSTASRLLATLERHGVVEQDPASERYRLGHGLVRLAGAVMAELDLVRAARPHLQELADETGETVNLAVLQGDRVINIDQINSSRQVVNVNWTGKQTPLHCTSNGKVLLAHLPEAERRRILAQPLQRFTNRTITDARLLERQLERVQADGYAFTLEELEIGLNAVAAAVRAAGGRVVGAVSVAGPSYRVGPQRLPELGEKTRRCAEAISIRLGHTTGGIPR